MREQDFTLAFLGPAGVRDPHRRPSHPSEKMGKRKRRMKRRCSVMLVPGPTAPPQMSKLGLREDAEPEWASRGWGVGGGWGGGHSELCFADFREWLVGGEGRVGFGEGRKN